MIFEYKNTLYASTFEDIDGHADKNIYIETNIEWYSSLSSTWLSHRYYIHTNKKTGYKDIKTLLLHCSTLGLPSIVPIRYLTFQECCELPEEGCYINYEGV